VRLMREIIKTSRLVRERESSWEFIEGEVNKLKNLLNNQEVNLSKVNTLIEKLEKEISNAKKLTKNQNQEEGRPNSSSWLSSHWKEAGVMTVFGFFLVTLVFVIYKKRKRLVLKSN
jgi:hypothetical protein